MTSGTDLGHARPPPANNSRNSGQRRPRSSGRTAPPASEAVGNPVELPTICGKHVVFYPMMMVHEAMRGRFYAFGRVCECPTTYLIHTEPDGAHCKAADTVEAISDLYEERSPARRS